MAEEWPETYFATNLVNASLCQALRVPLITGEVKID